MNNAGAYSPEFKAEVALEAVKGQKSDHQICSEYNISEDSLSQWKQILVEKLPILYADDMCMRQNQQQRIDELDILAKKLNGDIKLLRKALRFIMRILSIRRQVNSRALPQ
jgi:transposase-like protein